MTVYHYSHTYIRYNTSIHNYIHFLLSFFLVSGHATYATEALAGLASKENFSRLHLRKTESFGGSTPGSAGKNEPFTDLMLIHVKG